MTTTFIIVYEDREYGEIHAERLLSKADALNRISGLVDEDGVDVDDLELYEAVKVAFVVETVATEIKTQPKVKPKKKAKK